MASCFSTSAEAEYGWRGDLKWNYTFRSKELEERFQKYHRSHHTIRALRPRYFIVAIAWAAFVIESLLNDASLTVKIILATARLAPCVMITFYISLSFCTSVGERSAYEPGFPGVFLMGLVLGLQALLLNTDEMNSVPLGLILVMPLSTGIVRFQIGQAIVMSIFHIVIYMTCFWYPGRSFSSGIPVIFALFASAMTSLALAVEMTLRDRHFVWLLVKNHVGLKLDDLDIHNNKHMMSLIQSQQQTLARQMTVLGDAAPERLETSTITDAASTPDTIDAPLTPTPLLRDVDASDVPRASPSRTPESGGSPRAGSPTKSTASRGLAVTLQEKRLRAGTPGTTVSTPDSGVSETQLRSRWWLQFNDPVLESRFMEFMRREVYHELRVLLWVMLIGEAVFGISDYFTYPSDLTDLLAIRYGGTVPLFMMMLFMVRVPRLSKRVATWLPLMVGLVGGTKFLTIAILPLSLPLAISRTFAAAMIRFTIHAQASFHLRFVGMLQAAPLWVIGTVIIQFLAKQSPVEYAYQIAALALTLVPAYAAEKQYRMLFLLETYLKDTSNALSSAASPAVEALPMPVGAAWEASDDGVVAGGTDIPTKQNATLQDNE